MSADNSTNLKGFTSVFQHTLNNDILDGLVEFFDWALLEKGNYYNVSLAEQAPNGQDYSRLRSVQCYHTYRIVFFGVFLWVFFIDGPLLQLYI